MLRIGVLVIAAALSAALAVAAGIQGTGGPALVTGHHALADDGVVHSD
jgi:hypothetical protein